MANETLNMAQATKIAECFANWFRRVCQIPVTSPTENEYNAQPDDIKNQYTYNQWRQLIINQRKAELISIRDQLDADKAIIQAGENIGYYADIPVEIGYTVQQKQEFTALNQQIRDVGVDKWQTLNNL